MTREYIGARYVPKFYTNSVDGSAAWESNVVYEPLTYVTLTNGHMYISKKQVPATVGTPASNAEYWLDVGSYNGFIEDLQNQINAINNITIPAIVSEINNLTDDLKPYIDRKYIFIGDSYGHGSGQNNGWIDKLVVKMGLSASDYFDNALGGSGFGTSVSFKDLFDTLTGSMTAEQKVSITDVVVLGGANDRGYPASDMGDLINTFVSDVKNTTPNAKIHIGMCAGNYTNHFLALQGARVLDGYLAGSGYSYIDNIEYVLHDRSLIRNDKIHPTDGGYERLANFVAAYLNGGSMSVGYRDYQLITNSDGTMDVTNHALATIENNVASLKIEVRGSAFNNRKDFSYYTSVDTGLLINTLLFYGIEDISDTEYNMAKVSTMVSFRTWPNHDWKTYESTVEIVAGKIYVTVVDLGANGDTDLAAIDKISIPSIVFTCPSIYC